MKAALLGFLFLFGLQAWSAVPQNGVTLLGRIVSAKKKSLHLEYMVVDSTRDNVVIDSPALIALIGEKAQVEMTGEKEKVSVSLLANPAVYTESGVH